MKQFTIVTQDIREEMLETEKELCEKEELMEDIITRLMFDLKTTRKEIAHIREEIAAYDEAKEKIDKLLETI